MEKNANETAFLTKKKKKLNWKESVAAQKKKIVTYINADNFKVNNVLTSCNIGHFRFCSL